MEHVERPRVRRRGDTSRITKTIPTPQEYAEGCAAALGMAIINQAFKDLESKDEEIAKEAAAWLHSRRARWLMEATGFLVDEVEIADAIDRVLSMGFARIRRRAYKKSTPLHVLP